MSLISEISRTQLIQLLSSQRHHCSVDYFAWDSPAVATDGGSPVGDLSDLLPTDETEGTPLGLLNSFRSSLCTGFSQSSEEKDIMLKKNLGSRLRNSEEWTEMSLSTVSAGKQKSGNLPDPTPVGTDLFCRLNCSHKCVRAVSVSVTCKLRINRSISVDCRICSRPKDLFFFPQKSKIFCLLIFGRLMLHLHR